MQAAPLRSLLCRRFNVRRLTPCSTPQATPFRFQRVQRHEESYVTQRGSLQKSFATEGESTADVKFCRECRNALKQCIPPGDSRERLVCQRCGFIEYRNPKLALPSNSHPFHISVGVSRSSDASWSTKIKFCSAPELSTRAKASGPSPLATSRSASLQRRAPLEKP